MSKKFLLYGLTLGCLVAVLAPAATQAQTCEPLNNGRLADVFHEGTALFFEPVVEYRTMTLTIGGPCEDIVKVFGPKDQISFDIREIERIVDGQYSWELHREATVDEGVQKDLEASRGTGKEDALWWNYFQKGAIPEGPYVDSGSFTVERGQIIDPNSGEEKSASLAGKESRGGSSSAIQATLAGGLGSGDSGGESDGPVLATKDTVLTNVDGTIRNSLCVGFDCLNDNTYDDTTIMMTENNTRIKFDDTSSVNSFPRNDWEIEANSRLNGGANYLGFNDCGQSSGGGCADDLVFAVEAGVRQHALYVESDGDVGLGTNNPVVRLHVVDGDTPALRLEQDGSNGFQPQVWDVAGNETNFFVRDATGGSTLPFRIQPGGAPSSSIHIRNTGNVGMGTSSPSEALHVRRSDASSTSFLVENTNATTQVVSMVLDNTASNLGSWEFRVAGNGNLTVNDTDSTGQVMLFAAATGEVIVPGDLTVNGTFSNPSSRTLKTDIEPVDSAEVLERVASLPIHEWTYREDEGKRRHIGPFSEDFGSLFGLGTKGKNIIPMDVQGVTIAAVQGLYKTVQTLEDENAKLLQRLESLEQRLAEADGSTN